MNNRTKKLAQYHSGKKIGKFLGKGAYGYVYHLKNEENKIIKICLSDAEHFKNLDELMLYVKKQKNSSIVKIYEHGCFKDYLNDNFYHYYVMEKLKPIPRHEKEAFAEVFGLLYGSRKNSKFSFVSRKFINFLNKANSFKYDYDDIHSDNIMMDRFGNYKLIDLESFIL